MFGYTSLGYYYYSGYSHAQARDFDTSIGRFISEDTYEGQINDPQTLNLYTYVQNNPLRYTDPSGNKAWEPYDVNELRYLLNDAIAHKLNKGSDLYKAYYNKIRDRYGFASFMDTNRYNYLYGFLTGTSAYKNSAGNADWAREELIKAFFKENEAKYIADIALGAAAGVSMRNPTVGKQSKPSGKSSFGCNCFVSGTKVQTDEGEKNIEDIKVGDKVLSKNEETGEVAYKEVTDTFNHETDEIYKIQVGGQTIESTFNHPFYVKDKGWTFVKDLKVGDLLVQSDGNKLKIDSIELEHKLVTVYNMTVDEFHTYFVSDLGIWVHNTECSLTISKAAARVAKKLSPEAKKGYEAAIKGLETGDLRGLNAHPLSGNRKGQWAVDIKGSGSGRGDARVIYTKDSDGNINVVEVITTHNDY
ncbi:polymorphic toxin-type HINT domain-containing protein [Paenibacillus sp. BAC0078]